MDHLPAQEARHVINLLSGLFLYAYRTKNKKAKVTMENMEYLCHVGSTIVFRNEQASKRLIEQYLKLHPQLPKEDAACIARFQGCRKQQLYVMQYEQEYTFVMDRKGKTLYGVKGITDSLDFMLRNQTLPCMVQYAILPYKNHFILDSIGNTQAITDLSFVIELFEEYRGIAMEKGALLSEHETASFTVLKRNMHEKKEELFSDYLQPLSGILRMKGEDQKSSVLELALTAWNLSYGSDEQAEEFFTRDTFRRYVKPLMEYRRTAFTNVKFLIDRLEPPRKGETMLQVVEKKNVEQLELEL